MKIAKSLSSLSLALLPFAAIQVQAAVLPEAQTATKITLAKNQPPNRCRLLMCHFINDIMLRMAA